MGMALGHPYRAMPPYLSFATRLHRRLPEATSSCRGGRAGCWQLLPAEIR